MTFKKMFDKFLIHEYAKRSIKLDHILEGLTRDYYHNECEEEKRTCCTHNSYRIGISENFLDKQEEEAVLNGWKDTNSECRYITDSGCALKIYKPPICLGSICDILEKRLNKELPFLETEGFVKSMREVCHGSLIENYKSLIIRMDNSISFGNYLLSIR